KYLETRRRLVRYFDRKNCLTPDELADETLNRVARRLSEEGQIRDASPARYCYIVAKYVYLEHQRRPVRNQISLETLPVMGDLSAHPAPAEIDMEAQRMGCLESCLQQLIAEQRELILEYYRGEQRAKIEQRRRLAERLGLTTNALSIRAYRIRDRLEQ